MYFIKNRMNPCFKGDVAFKRALSSLYREDLMGLGDIGDDVQLLFQ